jgi:hypothetical protein
MFDLGSLVAAVSGIGEGPDDVARIDLIRGLEELKCAAEGAQAVLTAAFDRSQRGAEAAAGVPAERRGRAVAGQVALARRESPHRGRQHVGLALALRDELPGTREALTTGRITEWRAMLLARETGCLAREDRAEVDRRMAGTPDALVELEAMGDGELVAHARELAYELDPVSFVERRRRAEAERRVSLRPAPDVMSQLSTLLPVKAGVAVWAVLSREADRARAAGDERSRGQIMADALVERILRGTAESTRTSPISLMINVMVPDAVLLGDEDGFGWVQDFGPVPGDLLREWIAANAEDGVEQWVRRLYVTRSPASWLRWTPRPAGSRASWRSTSVSATGPAAPSGATPGSGTSTTPTTTPQAVRRPPRTAKGCARTATTPNRLAAGPPDLDPDPATSSRPSHPPATATPALLPR